MFGKLAGGAMYHVQRSWQTHTDDRNYRTFRQGPREEALGASMCCVCLFVCLLWTKSTGARRGDVACADTCVVTAPI